MFMKRSHRCEKPVMGMVCLGRAVSPDGWAMETRLALSDRYLDFVGLEVEGVGLRSIGLSASAASMSSGVKGLSMRNSLMLSDPSGFKYDVFWSGTSCLGPIGFVFVSRTVISLFGQFRRINCLVCSISGGGRSGHG